MKKIFTGMILFVAMVMCFALVGCSTNVELGKEEAQKATYSTYVAYAESIGEEPLTYEDWLESIKGDKGDRGDTGADGKSAYELAVEKGYSGTEEEWLGSLVGATGADGKSAYELALEKGYSGTEEEWLGSLVGATGADGKSAYQIWLDAGNTGTEEDFINSLKGDAGEQGVGIEETYIDDDGCLIIVYTDGTSQNVGEVVQQSSSGLSINEIKINSEKKLIIELTNGTIIQTAPIDVTFGGLVNGVSVNSDGEFFIYTTIGETVNYGKIAMVYVNNMGELVLKFESEDELSLGSITSSALACDHDFSEWNYDCLATCESVGIKTRTCENCEAKEFDVVECLGHQFGEGIIIKEFDGVNDGVVLYGCEVCGMAKMEKIAYSRGLEYELIKEDTEYKLVGIGVCEDENIVVPEKNEGLPITEIGDRAFYQCEQICSIEIPDSIKSIGEKAFSECSNLEEISMSDDVELGLDVFRGSIKVNIVLRHILEFVEGKESTCLVPGNIPYYYCSICDMYYEDANAEVRLYNVTIPAAHDFVSGVCSKCGTIQDEVLIVEIDEIAHLGKFALGTLESAIGLPDAINVKTADGLTHSLNIAWDLSGYDKSNVGEYNILGHIQAGGFFFDEGLTNEISAEVEIVEFMKGTADIVFVLDISGSMSDEIATVKDNINEFASALEEQGVSARWSVVTYSDFADVSGEESVIIMNGASPWYSSADEYKEAINSISLMNGGDTPEVAIDGLLLANTIENRKDARVFYILLTDASFKINNHYGVSSIEETAEILNDAGVNVSVITNSTYKTTYEVLNTTTGGIYANIYDNFANDLLENLVPIIYGEVIS